MKPDYASFRPQDAEAIIEAYSKASKGVFIVMSPFAGICLLTCAFVRDHGLVRPEEKETLERQKVEQEAKRNGNSNGPSDTKSWESHGMERDLENEGVPSTTDEAEDSKMEKCSEIEVESVSICACQVFGCLDSSTP